MSAKKDLEARFDRACDLLLGRLADDEALSLEYSAEDSVFLRFNRGLVRQIGSVLNAQASFKYYRGGRTLYSAVNLTGSSEEDDARLEAALNHVRVEASLLPEDPYQTLPRAEGTSREEFPGALPDPSRLARDVLEPAGLLTSGGAEFVGLHAQGWVCRGSAASSGARHWFSTQIFATDWSAYAPNGKAVKARYAGRGWDGEEWERRLRAEQARLAVLTQPEKVLAPGAYRVYLAPDALAEFMAFFSWYGLSERSLREGASAWTALREGRRLLSPLFSLTQDFSLGVQPRFNELGETAPETLPLIQSGRLVSTLVSARSARQYEVAPNAAPDSEDLRSPALAPGSLDEAAAAAALGTGLYISNLHYLNWSDFDSARVTGMTRFACVWVEDGRMSSPIKDMRFDESLYALWGCKLEGVTRQRSLVAEVGSYFRRELGGALLPGMLIDGFTFTL